MSTVLLIIQLIISLILTGLILIQRSEGGALGIGGGGGGGLMSGRSATNSISRLTWILGTVFIINCLALSIVFNMENQNTSLIDDTNAVAPLTETIDSVDTTIPLDDETSNP
ncbi:preprotein translocase subunit SecG [Hellea sp.]|nr:preprotein translocase subunit SecG [Hellea sp.]